MHNQVKLKEDFDVLIFAGDMLNYGDREVELYSFANWWNEIDCKHKICISGNHDGICYNWGKNKIQDFFDKNTHYLVDEVHVLPNGMRLYASPFSKRFMDWWFMYDNAEQQWSGIPAKIDILLTHQPPYKHIDIANPKYGHLGCEILDRKIHELKIPLSIFGHIHQEEGKPRIEKTEHTTYINAALLDDNYEMVHEPIYIEL
jgi:predicted phosphodiesterase